MLPTQADDQVGASAYGTGGKVVPISDWRDGDVVPLMSEARVIGSEMRKGRGRHIKKVALVPARICESA